MPQRYFTVAFTTLCHLVPVALAAMTVKRCDPTPRVIEVSSTLLLVSVYFFPPSTHSSMRASVPVIVAVAFTSTGVLTVDPFDGLHTCTPGDVGALHVAADTLRGKDVFCNAPSHPVPKIVMLWLPTASGIEASRKE
jgi:hypothetical protein